MALTGVQKNTKKNGSIYYRSSITFRSKHISLGSFNTEIEAHKCYLEAKKILENDAIFSPEDYDNIDISLISFSKWITLINFKNNGYYIKTPIYLRNNFFTYYLSINDVLIFDVDDLFYFSNHSIMRRGNHLFVAEYGMQTNIHSRYGIRNFARLNKDFRFVNGDTKDFRYSNIEIINPYQGITIEKNDSKTTYCAKIHLKGDFVIGRFSSIEKAAIAYNKIVDYCAQHNYRKSFEKNYIENLNTKEYLAIYNTIFIPPSIKDFITS